jgi:hypothetical protein
VFLPAQTLQQTYVAAFVGEHGDGAAPIARQVLTVTWPADVLDRPSLPVAPEAYGPYEGDLPRWPAAALRNVFLTVLLGCIALAAALFIRRPPLRAAAALAAVAAATAAAAGQLHGLPTVIRRDVPAPSADQGPEPGGSLTVLTCRRSAVWSDPEARLVPIYQFPHQLAEETMTIHAEKGVRLRLIPQEIRLLRRPRR